MIGKCTSGRKSVRHNDACLGSVICVLVYCYLKKVSLTPFAAAEYLVFLLPPFVLVGFFYFGGEELHFGRDINCIDLFMRD